MAYLSWSFLKMGEKAERSTSFLFLLMAGVPVLFAAFFAFVAGMTAILYAGPVLALMLLPFYLPCALREERRGMPAPVIFCLAGSRWRSLSG